MNDKDLEKLIKKHNKDDDKIIQKVLKKLNYIK